MVFHNFNPELQKVITKRFKTPTLPQELAIKPILDGKNVLLIAQTGTGKTESAMLPLFNMVMERKSKPISILYITPLRSLNRDLLDRLIWWCNELGLEASVRHGDTSAYERKMQSEFPPQLLITTPETIQAILSGKILKEHLKNVKWVVIDEIHELADSKRGIQLTVGLERVRELCGDFQIIGLSATVGKPEQIAQFISPRKPIEIIKADTTKAYDIKVICPRPNMEDGNIADRLFTSKETAARIRTIIDLIKKHRSVLTFTNTREFAEILSSRIKTLDKEFPIGVHHSSLSKEVRIKTEKEFKEEKIKSIISTSSLQLGIDIGSIDLIIQYMSPRTVSQLIQRVGRSGHEQQRVSKGIVVATEEDDIFEAAVIARRALAGELEELKFHENCFDILAHQLVGLAMDHWDIETGKAYEIIKRAFPFRNLKLEDFNEVLKQLQSLYMINSNGTIRKMRRGFDYYFSQLSTIPDSKQYRIFNTLDNSFVGVLDEEFVAIHGEPNTTFIIKGQAWKIIQVEEGKVLAEPVEDIEAAIPGWEGELIPVPFEIAQEVGRLRRMIKEKLEDSEIGKEIKKIYPVDDNCVKKMVKLIESQKKFGTVPDDKNFLVEDIENVLIFHTCLGAMTNESLGRFMVALLTSRIGSVGLKTDPYRIILEFQKRDLELVKEILFKTDPNLLRNYLELSVSKSPLFEWKFVHVAKRFGAITRDANYGKVRLGKIIDSYAGTPIYEETMKELEVDKFDIEKATEILRKIQSKEIKLIFKPGLSPLGKLGLKEKYAEVIGPDRPESEIFELFRKRLMNTKVRLVCVNCGLWDQAFPVKEIPDKLKCSHCGAKLIATVHPRFTEIKKIIKKKIEDVEMGIEEKKRYERARKSADLFLVYGKKAPIALAARGIGPQTASRILAGMYRNEDEFLRAILEAERNYIKTRKYWSV
ncbi:MAG: DEAD/DEAH box helicase [Candidatus Aenigmatarchaeota archaeon]